MPKPWGVVANCELDVRPGGIFSIDIASAEGQEFPNLGCFLEVIPNSNERYRGSAICLLKRKPRTSRGFVLQPGSCYRGEIPNTTSSNLTKL